MTISYNSKYFRTLISLLCSEIKLPQRVHILKYKLSTEISIPLCSWSSGTTMHTELKIAPWSEIWSANKQIHIQVLMIVYFWYNPHFDLKLKNRRWLEYQTCQRSNILKLTGSKTLCAYLWQRILPKLF